MESRQRKIAELKNLLKQMSFVKENDKQHVQDKRSDGQVSSHRLSRGTHPDTGKFFSNTNDNKNGYASLLMLGLITFIFESLFLVISYFIFK